MKLAECVSNCKIETICNDEVITIFISDFSKINVDQIWTKYLSFTESQNEDLEDTPKPNNINELILRIDEKDDNYNLKYPSLSNFLDDYIILNDIIYNQNKEQFYRYFWIIAYHTRNTIVHYTYDTLQNKDIENLAKYCYSILDLLF